MRTTTTNLPVKSNYYLLRFRFKQSVAQCARIAPRSKAVVKCRLTMLETAVFLKNAPLKHGACYIISSASIQNRLNRTNTVKLR
jgi:hypothetical protein